KHAYVTTRLPGKIAKLHAQPGDTVSAGQTLAEVQSLDLEDLQNELLTAENSRKLSEKIVDSLEQLARQGATSESALREAQVEHQQTLNTLAIARFKWHSLGLPTKDLDRLLREGKPALAGFLPILSPISGKVVHADLTVGRVVEPGEHLFEVMDVSQVWAKIGVLEKDLHRIKAGQPVEIALSAYPRQVFTSTVQSQAVYIDP